MRNIKIQQQAPKTPNRDFPLSPTPTPKDLAKAVKDSADTDELNFYVRRAAYKSSSPELRKRAMELDKIANKPGQIRRQMEAAKKTQKKK